VLRRQPTAPLDASIGGYGAYTRCRGKDRVRAKAAIPLPMRNRLCRPEREFLSVRLTLDAKGGPKSDFVAIASTCARALAGLRYSEFEPDPLLRQVDIRSEAIDEDNRRHKANSKPSQRRRIGTKLALRRALLPLPCARQQLEGLAGLD
jgi:hypothetical protein